MIAEVQTLLDEYVAWLKSRTSLRQIGEWVEITTPFLDRHNDHLQIYARKRDGRYVLTDDGYVLTDLEQSGCRLDTPRRQALLRTTLNGFGIQLAEGRLETQASSSNFAQRKHNLVQAMLAVNDLFYLASPVVTSLFLEDVVTWLDLNDVRYTPRIKFTGKSGFDHLFDFVVPRSRERPERVIKAINHPGRDSAEALTFAWVDTREVRPEGAQAFALLNDASSKVSAGVLDALRSYDVSPVLWSERGEALLDLAA